MIKIYNNEQTHSLYFFNKAPKAFTYIMGWGGEGSGGEGRGGGPYSEIHRRDHLKGVAFFKVTVYQRVGKIIILVY